MDRLYREYLSDLAIGTLANMTKLEKLVLEKNYGGYGTFDVHSLNEKEFEKVMIKKDVLKNLKEIIVELPLLKENTMNQFL